MHSVVGHMHTMAEVLGSILTTVTKGVTTASLHPLPLGRLALDEYKSLSSLGYRVSLRPAQETE